MPPPSSSPPFCTNNCCSPNNNCSTRQNQYMMCGQNCIIPYGTVYTDTLSSYEYNNKLYKFEYMNPSPCMQFTNNLLQFNRRNIVLPDPNLTDVDSELKGINQVLSKMPQTRYPFMQNTNLVIKDTNQNECGIDKKIVNDYNLVRYNNTNGIRLNKVISNTSKGPPYSGVSWIHSNRKGFGLLN